MNSTRNGTLFWRRRKPPKSCDITLLRPASLSKNARFETRADVFAESQRSEGLSRATVFRCHSCISVNVELVIITANRRIVLYALATFGDGS
jgi:hypothetical protein